MIHLILSILISSSLFVIFKLFGVYKVNSLHAIVFNYFVAFTLGFGLSPVPVSLELIPHEPWFFGALSLGLLFVSIFLVMALTAQKNGVSVASVAAKMSIIIPVIFGVVLYKESLGWLKIVGVLIALVAVYLSSVKEESGTGAKASLLLPILLFFGSGIIDTSLKYVEKNFVTAESIPLFSGSLFGFAAFFGVMIILIKNLRKRETFEVKSLIAGVVLGVPNYFSIFFLIKALQIKHIESSTLFTINNVGIVVMSTLFGFLLFKEQFSLKNKIGIGLALLGIFLVAIA